MRKKNLKIRHPYGWCLRFTFGTHATPKKLRNLSFEFYNVSITRTNRYTRCANHHSEYNSDFGNNRKPVSCFIIIVTITKIRLWRARRRYAPILSVFSSSPFPRPSDRCNETASTTSPAESVCFRFNRTTIRPCIIREFNIMPVL